MYRTVQAVRDSSKKSRNRSVLPVKSTQAYADNDSTESVSDSQVQHRLNNTVRYCSDSSTDERDL